VQRLPFFAKARARHPELVHRFVFVTGTMAHASDPFFETVPLLFKPVSRADLRAAIEAVLVS